MKTRILSVFTFLVLVVSLTTNAAYPPPSGAYRPSQSIDRPAQLLRKKLNHIQEFMQQGGGRDTASIMKFLEDEVAGHLDMDRMAQWVAGPYYQAMSDAQRQKFQSQLKDKIFIAISRQLSIFSNQDLRLNFFPPRRTGPAEVAIAMRILQPYQAPMRLTYNFHYDDQKGWRAYDISMNGMSAIAHYRTLYRQAARQYGPEAFFR